MARTKISRMKKWNLIPALMIALVLSFGFASIASSASWFTGRTVDGQTKPLSALAKESPDSELFQAMRARILRQDEPQSTPIDLIVVLESNPQGDDRKVHVEWMEHFADAIWEATNKGHILRNIRIFRDSRNKSSADIFVHTNLKKKRGSPHVKFNGGVSQKSGKIHMYEFAVMKDNSTHNYLNDPENAGYTLAHEMGHYYYGLYDEYDLRRDKKYVDKDSPVEPSIMNHQWSASNYYSTWNNKGYLNFSIAKFNNTAGLYENTENTQQHRALSASGWEVISRSPDDDPCKPLINLFNKKYGCTAERYQKANTIPKQYIGKRVHYPELAAFSPGFGQHPPLFLASNDGRSKLYYLNADGNVETSIPTNDPRAQLRVIWMTGDIDSVISIDRSGSMTTQMLNQAKTAAKALVDQFILGESRVAITSYDSHVTTNYPLTLIDTEAKRDEVKAAIDGITRGGMTAIGDAARDALNKLLAAPAPGNTQVVYLLTDGMNNSGENPRNVIPDYQTAQIPIFTFGFGSNPDRALMQEMAEQTGGKYYYASASAIELTKAFQEAGTVASGSPSIRYDSLELRDGQTSQSTFNVDPSVSRILATLYYTGSSNQTSVWLMSPDGQRFDLLDETEAGGETVKTIIVDAPTSGEWRMQGEGIGTDIQATYYVTANVAGMSYEVHVDTSQGIMQGDAALGEPVILTLVAMKQAAITDMAIDAWIQSPSGIISEIQFADNGIGDDALAQDGVYTASFIPTEPGTYKITANVSNDQGQAQFTDIGGLFTIGPNGELGEGGIIGPVDENFNRHASYDLTVGDNVLLAQGWNLMSIYRQPSNTSIGTVLSNIAGEYASVWSYKDGEWKVYDPLNPGLSDLNSIEAGWGYWLNMDEPVVLSFSGSQPSKSTSLSSGWNLVGYNLSTSHSMDDALASISGQVEIVWAFINGQWLVYDPVNPGFSDLQAMAPGYGYWIKTSEACIWTLP